MKKLSQVRGEKTEAMRRKAAAEPLKKNERERPGEKKTKFGRRVNYLSKRSNGRGRDKGRKKETAGSLFPEIRGITRPIMTEKGKIGKKSSMQRKKTGPLSSCIG